MNRTYHTYVELSDMLDVLDDCFPDVVGLVCPLYVKIERGRMEGLLTLPEAKELHAFLAGEL